MEKIYRVQMNSKGMPNFSTAVEIADRPQGEWIDEGRNLWGCSNCGMEIYSESEQDRNEFHKWCSRCGARMKGADAVEVADRPQEWIPCSERLPQIGQKVLASTKKTVFTQVFKGYYSEPNNWMWEHNSVKTIEAWMPLPKPWKGADDETN